MKSAPHSRPCPGCGLRAGLWVPRASPGWRVSDQVFEGQLATPQSREALSRAGPPVSLGPGRWRRPAPPAPQPRGPHLQAARPPASHLRRQRPQQRGQQQPQRPPRAPAPGRAPHGRVAAGLAGPSVPPGDGAAGPAPGDSAPGWAGWCAGLGRIPRHPPGGPSCPGKVTARQALCPVLSTHHPVTEPSQCHRCKNRGSELEVRVTGLTSGLCSRSVASPEMVTCR